MSGKTAHFQPLACIAGVWRPPRQPVSHPKKQRPFLGDPGLETGATGSRRVRGMRAEVVPFQDTSKLNQVLLIARERGSTWASTSDG